MKIMYLTQWFDPEPGVIKGPAFVRQIEAAGHQVTVVTGFPNYPTGKIYPGYKQALLRREIIGGVHVERIPLYPSHSHSSVGRAINFISFFASAFVYGLLRSGKADLIYVYHPPITVGLAAALFGWVRGKKFVIEIQDLWPDMLSASGMAGTGRLARILGPVCNFVYARAAHVIVQSEGMRTRLIERGVPPKKLTTIRNPADPTALERPQPANRSDLGFSDRLAILYGGNLGAAQQLATAIRAAKLAEDRGARFDLRIMGRGIEADNLKTISSELASDAVTFRDAVPKEDITAIFRAADVLLIQLAPDPLFDITIPSKTQFYLAAGRPILAALSGETDEILRESGAAIVVPPADVEAMADAIVALASMPKDELAAMGRNGENYSRDSFSFEKVVEATLAVIDVAAK